MGRSTPDSPEASSTPRTRRRPPRWVPAFCAVMLGVLTTLGIAWGAAVLTPTMPPVVAPSALVTDAPEPDGWRWFITEHASFARHTYIWRRSKPAPDAPMRDGERTTRSLSAWTTVPDEGMKVDMHGYGLPLVCLTGYTADPSDANNFRVIRGWSASSGDAWLPVVPWWPGLLADIAIFSVLWGALLFGPGALRRILRRRKGRCVACGYHLAGDITAGCPECGRGRKDGRGPGVEA